MCWIQNGTLNVKVEKIVFETHLCHERFQNMTFYASEVLWSADSVEVGHGDAWGGRHVTDIDGLETTSEPGNGQGI